MTPYYEHAGIQIFHGDCYDLIPRFGDHAVVTDPPYGINLATHYGGGTRGGAYAVPGKNFPPVYGDKQPFLPEPFLRFPFSLFWGAEHFASRLPEKGRWLVWDKRCGLIPERDQGDVEFAWASAAGVSRAFRHIWAVGAASGSRARV